MVAYVGRVGRTTWAPWAFSFFLENDFQMSVAEGSLPEGQRKQQSTSVVNILKEEYDGRDRQERGGKLALY